MTYLNDWMLLGLIVGLMCGGLVAGRSVGSLAACWLTGGAWLGFRLADRLWKLAVVELRTENPQLDLASWIPTTYGLLFVVLVLPSVLGVLWLRPAKTFSLPDSWEDLVGALAGLACAVVLFLALVQAHVMHPDAPKKIPVTLDAVRPLLSKLGQTHIAPNAQPGALAKPETPATPTAAPAPAARPR